MYVFVYVSLECLILLEVTTCIVQSIRRETHMIQKCEFHTNAKSKEEY